MQEKVVTVVRGGDASASGRHQPQRLRTGGGPATPQPARYKKAPPRRPGEALYKRARKKIGQENGAIITGLDYGEISE